MRAAPRGLVRFALLLVVVVTPLSCGDDDDAGESEVVSSLVNIVEGGGGGGGPSCACSTGACCDGCNYYPAGTSCRPATGTCDLTETCTGQSDACPADLLAPAGATCSDGMYCTTADQCNSAGICVPGAPRDCLSAAGFCTLGMCDEGLDQCRATPDPGCSPAC